MGAQRAPGLGTRREGEGASGARSQRNHERAQSVMLIGGFARSELRRVCTAQFGVELLQSSAGDVFLSGALRGFFPRGEG
mmetsp:Transcript_30927/g.86372  ORF Transcript_30927/g.86372 Transcript_30927/m.86372 type:complete len:80 (+) Transcript_30927:63-302(+)